MVDVAPASVVICTRARPRLLERCLASLAGQSGLAEVLVVDNGAPQGETPQGETAQIVAAAGATYLSEPRRGSSPARNRGLWAARATIVAFIDDDCEAQPGWLAALRQPFAAPDVHAVTGQVLPVALTTPAQRLFDRSFPYSKGTRWRSFGPRPQAYPFPLNANEMGTGASMAFRRSTLVQLGGFVEALSAGGPARGGEDIQALYGLLLAGHRLVYQPAAQVRHPHPKTAAELDRVFFDYGVAHFAYLTHCCWIGRDARALRRGTAVLLDYARRLAVPRPTDPPRRYLLRHLAGSLLGPVRYAVARRAYARR